MGKCKLVLQGRQLLYLHEVLYAQKIQLNLVFIFALLKLGYNLYFSYNYVKIYLISIFCGSSFLLDIFIVLDNLFYNYDNTTIFSLFIILKNMNINANI